MLSYDVIIRRALRKRNRGPSEGACNPDAGGQATFWRNRAYFRLVLIAGPMKLVRLVSSLTVALAAAPLLASASAAGAHCSMLSKAGAGDRVLVVAPHIDDEALAAGGYLQDAVANGADVFVVYMTAGDHSRTAVAANRLTFFATARLNRKGLRRLAEGEHATRVAGVAPEHVFMLGYPDRGLRRMLLHPDRTIRSASTGRRAVPYIQAVSPAAPYRFANLLNDLERVIAEVNPTIVIAPSEKDRHPDHRASSQIVDRALADDSVHAEQLRYTVHSWSYEKPFAVRNGVQAAAEQCSVYPLSGDTVERKRAMLAQYRSQRRSPYLRRIFAAFSGNTESFTTPAAAPASRDDSR